MAAIAAVTEKVRLATGVLILPWRTPSLVVLAKQLATLDVLSDGRLILGVGVGAYREESDALHIRERRARVDEGIQGLRELFEKPKASFAGMYVRFTDVELYPKPIQRPLPIVVGEHRVTPAILDRIARYAQGWVPGISPEQFRDAQPKLRDALRRYGRDLSEVELVREIPVSLAENRETAIRRYRETPAYAHKVSLLEQWGWKPSSVEDIMGTSLIGTADDVIEGIQRYLDVNVRHFMLNFSVTKPQDFTKAMEDFSGEIMPSFVGK